jgi:hypothetical protein
MAKIKISKRELEEQLIEQIDLLESSCERYDTGKTHEVKNIATRIRVLLHDTQRSKSLLGQLKRKSNLFYSSSLPFSEKSNIGSFGLSAIAMRGGDTKHVPLLDDFEYSAKWLPFDQWWKEEIVIKDKDLNTITRHSLITAVANQDGGAHVDEGIDEDYYNLSRNNSLGYELIADKSKSGIPEAEKAAVRQIGHEILKTLNPDYIKRSNLKHDGLIANIQLVEGEGNFLFPESVKPKRNEICPCGSGVKYKNCHGK